MTVVYSCKRCDQNTLISKIFLAQVNAHKGFLFKVNIGETESWGTINHLIVFISKRKKKLNKHKTKEARILFGVNFCLNVSGTFIASKLSSYGYNF